MPLLHLLTSYFLINTIFPGLTHAIALQKREESGKMSCYNAGNIIDFSALCVPSNYPVSNNRGLNIFEIFFYAMNTTTLSPDTMYSAGENIICAVHTPGPNITVTVGANVSGGPVSAGASLIFQLGGITFDSGGLCVFTEGTENSTAADPITLLQATNLMYTLVTNPNAGCKSCGRIPIRYPNVTDGSSNGGGGGILKIDYKSNDNCIGKCVGPNSFQVVTNTTANNTKSAATRLLIPSLVKETGTITVIVSVTFWASIVIFGQYLMG